jgi:hypothetical protein
MLSQGEGVRKGIEDNIWMKNAQYLPAMFLWLREYTTLRLCPDMR